SAGGRRAAGLGRHTHSRGPSGAIVPATSAARVLPASNPWAIQTRGAFVAPSVGATISNGSLGRALHAVVSVRQRSKSAVAARNARLGNGSCARRAGGRLSSGRIRGARSLAHAAASESAPGARYSRVSPLAAFTAPTRPACRYRSESGPPPPPPPPSTGRASGKASASKYPYATHHRALSASTGAA